MVLTRDELIGSLQHEVRILLHLATKIDPQAVNYRPTPKQRSTLELLRYLSFMGPTLAEAARAGKFDPAAWGAAEQAASRLDFDQTVAAIAALPPQYTAILGRVSDEAFREPVEIFGRKTTRGAFIVNVVLAGYAAYRTQLFVYLKACGRHELGTMNLWAGMDPAPAQA